MSNNIDFPPNPQRFVIGFKMIAAAALRGCRRLPSVAAVRAPIRRSMGGGHQPISQSMEAELFQGHPKEPEGWETTVYITYATTVVILTCALGFAPDTSIKTVSTEYIHVHLPNLFGLPQTPFSPSIVNISLHTLIRFSALLKINSGHLVKQGHV